MRAPANLHLLLLTGILLAGAPAFGEDPPLRVGRISYIEGTVSFHAADEDNWNYATLNYPVVAGNAFWTEPDARSEVQMGAIEVRMDHGTEMQVTRLDENGTQISVPQGTVNVHFSTVPAGGGMEVVTPMGPIELTRPGTYHIDSGHPAGDMPSQAVQVTALEGQLEIRGPRSLLQVMPGETAILSGNPPGFSLQEGAPTPFDDWALARERREEAHAAAQYVSPYMTGYEDLDRYGQWAPTPGYGAVWYPAAVQADWAPYRYGHWAYIAPWGWTWVDNAPWGFAPFHYGRWAYIGHRWGWMPGQIEERPVYAPALVAFVGGPGWNLSLAVGGASPAIGWVPLGPHEVFHPYYPTSVNYIRSVNVANIDKREINNITINNVRDASAAHYVNQQGATVVPAHAFEQGEAVHKALMPVSHEQLAHAPMPPMLTHPVPPRPQAEEAHAARPAENPRPPERHDAPHPVAMATAGHAPGPHIRHEAAPAQPHSYTPPAAPHAPLPKAEVPHPQQHAPIRPTPQGWQRGEPPHPAAPHPAQEQHDPHERNEQR